MEMVLTQTVVFRITKIADEISYVICELRLTLLCSVQRGGSEMSRFQLKKKFNIRR